MALFDGFDWGKIGQSFLETAPSIVTSVIGNRVANRGNTQAAQIAQAGNAAALAEMRTARERAEAMGAPGVSYMRSVVARDPGMLTPAQAQSVADAQLEFNRGPGLKTYGGRAYSRMFSDMTDRTRAAAIEQNQRRSDAAAQNLGQIASQGRQMTPTIAQYTARGPAIGANALTANATTTADTWGEVGSLIANSLKDADRERRYRDYESSYR